MTGRVCGSALFSICLSSHIWMSLANKANLSAFCMHFVFCFFYTVAFSIFLLFYHTNTLSVFSFILCLFVLLTLYTLFLLSLLSDRWLTPCLVQQLSSIISSHPNEHTCRHTPPLRTCTRTFAHTRTHRQIHAHTNAALWHIHASLGSSHGGTNYLKMHH